MTLNSITEIKRKSPYAGSGSLTREQFLFFEMRTTAKLLMEELSEEEIFKRIYDENLFQFPTEKSIRLITTGCIRRLKAMNDDSLITALATQPTDIAKQICLYAMMKQSKLVWDFMLSVVGEKYRQKDMSFGKKEANIFLMRLQEQDDYIATWSESTISKIRQILIKILVETEYLDNINTDHLNPVLLSRVLENGIRNNNDEIVFPAFNYFE
ncbi:MAG: DUF1819 family protein [Clostridiales bacterium]|nr:DUF1819 family protein [Clostridiales bacterium]